MNWDWWYRNRLLSVGGPMTTTCLALGFLIAGHVATSLCLLFVATGEVVAWFYRWIEWREPEPREPMHARMPGSASTSPAFRR